jgi:hypothetical protein
VLGAGQVGKAIYEVLRDNFDTILHDVGATPELVDVIHICFPWSSPAFINDVKKAQRTYRPALTIIHSTVPVGTSRILKAVHSPVTGKHPNLAESIYVFTKFFGGVRASEAATIFGICGVRTEIAPSSEATEAGKLWQTLQYGWLIALQKEAYSEFEHPEFVYDRMNAAYNEGYAALGEPYRLPIMQNVAGKIGGHCVIPNTELTDSPLADWLAELNTGW